MKPVALRLKNEKLNPYTGRISGELMIIHRCINCGRISSNRVAGDDSPQQILRLLEEPKRLGRAIIDELENSGIKPLTQKDKKLVLTFLFGYDYEKHTR